MVFIKIINFFINFAKGITFIFFIFLLAILLASFNLANKESKNPFCLNLNVNSIEINDIMVKEYEYKVECSTIYLYINVNDEIDESNVKKLSELVVEPLKKYQCYIHLQIDGISLDKTMYASYNYKNDSISFLGG